LIFHDRNLWRIEWPPSRWLVVSSVWVTVMALVVPTCAAVAVPRLFGVALLAGWIGGGAAIFRFHYLWTRDQYGGGTGSGPMIIFGFTLLALSAVTSCSHVPRQGPSSSAQHRGELVGRLATPKAKQQAGGRLFSALGGR
jgi:hypothetical protein